MVCGCAAQAAGYTTGAFVSAGLWAGGAQLLFCCLARSAFRLSVFLFDFLHCIPSIGWSGGRAGGLEGGGGSCWARPPPQRPQREGRAGVGARRR